MKIHHLQHVPFETLGSMEPALKQSGHELSATHLYKNESFPLAENIDWLIVMGGPMSVHDENIHPWLKTEKQFIEAILDAGKIVLGICLGAQLIADVLGARVYKNRHREIGWFPINRSPEVDGTILSEAMPNQIGVFHWHGETFDIPKNAKKIAESEACQNQGFIIDDRVVALQFHLETTCQSARALIDHCRDELDGSRYVQSAREILTNPQRFTTINQVMCSVLDALESKHSE